MVHRSRRSKIRKRIVPRKSKRSVRRKRRGGFKSNSLSRKTCTEVFEKKPGFSRGHYSACKWLRPDLYKETKKGVFDWTRRSRSKKAPITPTPILNSAATTPSIPLALPTTPSAESLTTVTHSVADSPPDRSIVETTTTTTEPIFTTSSSQQDVRRGSESSVNSRPLTETLGDLKLGDEWAQAGTHIGGRKIRPRQSRSKPRRSHRKTRRNSKMTHFFRA